MTHWVAAYVTPRKEFEFAAAMGAVAFAPKLTAMSKPKRKRKAVLVEKPMIPGMVFCQVGESTPDFGGHQHFRRLVSLAGRPCAINDNEMRVFMGQCEAMQGQLSEVKERQIQRGMKLRVKRGPAQGYDALVLKDGPGADGRIIVEISGMPVRIPLSFF